MAGKMTSFLETNSVRLEKFNDNHNEESPGVKLKDPSSFDSPPPTYDSPPPYDHDSTIVTQPRNQLLPVEKSEENPSVTCAVIFSLFVLICCCLPIGIAGLVFSSKILNL